MAKMPLTSVLVLVICYTLHSALLVTARFPSKKISSFSYGLGGWNTTNGLAFQGDANFTSGSDFIRLTRTTPQSIGRVLYTKPIPLWREKSKASFATTVKIVIKPASDGPESNEASGDGLVFFMTAINSTVNAPGASFGVFDEYGQNPSLFAVEFDHYINEFDPNYPHVGIDFGSRISSNVTEVAGMLRNEVTADISYYSDVNLISVRGSYAGVAFNEVTYVYDLSTLLPQQVQVGISAATGKKVAVHELIYWTFAYSHI